MVRMLRYPLRPPPYVNLLEPFHFFTAGDQLVVPRGVTHISCHYKNTIEGTGENKTNEQTRTICLGLTQEQKGSMQHYNSDSIYGLTLAWITSENCAKQLECRHLLTRSSLTVAGPSCHAASPLYYGVRSRLFLSVSRHQLLPAPFPNQLSFRVPLPLLDTARFQVPKPFVWFRAKTDKGIVCLAGHPHSVTRTGLNKSWKHQLLG